MRHAARSFGRPQDTARRARVGRNFVSALFGGEVVVFLDRIESLRSDELAVLTFVCFTALRILAISNEWAFVFRNLLHDYTIIYIVPRPNLSIAQALFLKHEARRRAEAGLLHGDLGLGARLYVSRDGFQSPGFSDRLSAWAEILRERAHVTLVVDGNIDDLHWLSASSITADPQMRLQGESTQTSNHNV